MKHIISANEQLAAYETALDGILENEDLVDISKFFIFPQAIETL